MSSCCCSPVAKAAPPGDHRRKSRPSPWRFTFLAVAILFAGLSMTVSLAINLEPPTGMARTISHGILMALSAAGLVLLGWPILSHALARRLTLEHLYLVGLTGAFAASVYSSLTGIGHIYYEVVLILLAIYHFGRVALRAATEKAADLANQIPGLRTPALLVEGDGVREIPASTVSVGQRLRVPAGAFVPADGAIIKGRAFVEELAHTGEPFPAARQPGDRILAGSRVLDGTIEMTATASGRDRELDRLLSACRDTEPSPAENLARRLLNWFVPLVVTIALVTGVIWGVILNEPAQALFNALAVTIVACPCALGLAVPLAAKQALMRLRLMGVLPQSHDLVERLAAIDVVAFDKTGTLSHPRLGLDRLVVEADSPVDLPSWLAAIQRHSTHPVARPFWTLDEPADLAELELEPVPAVGIKARFFIDGVPQVLTIGNSALLGAEDSTADRRLYVVHNGILVATAWLSESPRGTVAHTIRSLRGMTKSQVVLTGDRTCPDMLSGSLEIHVGMTAERKAKWVRDRQTQGGAVLFIGDGLNDAEALRQAHAGIALRSGSRAASSTADAILSHDDLSVLPEAISLARRTRRMLVRLLAFSLIYNGCGITLAVTGLLHPVAAALLMLASSATVLAAVNRPAMKARRRSGGELPPQPV